MLGSPIEFVLVTAYAPLVSMRALESKTLNDDTNMLAFWVTWTILSAIESITWGLVWIIPFFTELRFALLVYMLFFEGGKKVYTMIIDPTYQKAKKKIPEEVMDQIEKDPKAALMAAFEQGKAMVQQFREKQAAAAASAPKDKKKKQAK
ncbi:unnamed protein product [Effrenium voratum]|nr:unnamed protein product [Effrenium voratum]